MKRLSHNDLQALLLGLADLYSDIGQNTLSERTLALMTGIISADITTFDCWITGGLLGRLSWGSATERPTAEQLEALGRFVHENPVFVECVAKRRTVPVKLTDFLSPAKFRTTNVYNEFYRFIEADIQMAIALPVSSDTNVTCQLTRSRKDFSERDRSIMTLVAPHLINAFKSTLAFERLNSALETKDSGVIAIDRAGKLQFVSEFARRALDKYFGNELRGDDSLPERLSHWIGHSSLPATEFDLPSLPLRITNGSGELTVRLLQNSRTLERTLLLEEKRTLTPKMLESLNLTKRESQVLFWLAQGKSDGDIAVLCNISPHTVHKHVQNIFIKLGVETRTAAMLKALEVL